MRQFESVRDFCSVGKEKVKYSAIAECEIIHFVNCEISHAAFGSVRCEMKFAGIRVSEYFTRRRHISHFAEIFHLPEGQISLKKALARASAFFCHKQVKRSTCGGKTEKKVNFSSAAVCSINWNLAVWRRCFNNNKLQRFFRNIF